MKNFSIDQIQLNPLEKKLCFTKEKYCINQKQTLRMKTKWFSKLFGTRSPVTNTDSGEKLFEWDRKFFTLLEINTLLTADGNPILNLREKFLSDDVNMHEGGKADHRMCVVRSKFAILRLKLEVDIKDTLSRENRKIYIKGNRRYNKFALFLGDPDKNGIPLARITKLTAGLLTFDPNEYLVEIAPNFDTAFTIGVCGVIDQILTRYVNELESTRIAHS